MTNAKVSKLDDSTSAVGGRPWMIMMVGATAERRNMRELVSVWPDVE